MTQDHICIITEIKYLRKNSYTYVPVQYSEIFNSIP